MEYIAQPKDDNSRCECKRKKKKVRVNYKLECFKMRKYTLLQLA